MYVLAFKHVSTSVNDYLTRAHERNFQFEWRLSAYVFVYLICTAPLYGGST